MAVMLHVPESERAELPPGGAAPADGAESGVIPESGVLSESKVLPESGVIRDARRHRRRERIVVSLLFLAVIGAVLSTAGAGDGVQPARPHSARPHWMTGAPLGGSTHLRLLVSQNGGPLKIVDVDSGRVQTVAGLGLPRVHRLWGPMLWPLTRVVGGALGVVVRDPCRSCVVTETHYLITPAGVVKRLSALRLQADQSATTPVHGSSTASWVLTHPRGRPCTLTRDPGTAPGVTVPCGGLAQNSLNDTDMQAGLIISTPSRMVLVDPRSGRVLASSPRGGQLDVLGRNLVLTGGPAGVQDNPAPPLTLINLTTGTSRHLHWPSTLRFGYQVFPDPSGTRVAVEFADPAYHASSRQAADVWMLNTRTGDFSHVPGFPIFEYLKVSGMAWTADHRLVLAAYGRRHPSIGIWRPGSRQLQVGALPQLNGYLEFVPFGR